MPTSQQLVGWMFSPIWNAHQKRLRAIPRLLLQSILGVLLMIVVMIPLYVALSIARLTTDGVAGIVFGGIGQIMGVVLSVWLAGWLIDRRTVRIDRWELGFRRWWWSDLGLGFALGAIVMTAIFGLEYWQGWIEVVHVGARPETGWITLLASQAGWLGLMIAVGYSEELLSRGYHLKNMAEGLRWMGVWPAVCLAAFASSALFGLLHLSNDHANLISTLSLLVAGLMLAVGRIATGSLAAPIGLHISWNYFQGPLWGFPVSGNACPNSFVQVQQLGDPFWTGGEFGPEAGILGLASTLLLIAVFVVWGRARGRLGCHAARLARFRRTPSSAASGA